jgi:hypothetical protein
VVHLLDFLMPTSKPLRTTNIRCQVGLPSGMHNIMFRDEDEIRRLRYMIRTHSKYFFPVLGWEHEKFEIVPAHVDFFRRNDT